MTNPTCTLCGRPTDGYACHACAQGWERKLHTIAELVPDARAVAARQTRRTAPVRGSGGARPLPLQENAGAKLDAVQNELTTWARHVAEERGLRVRVPDGTDVVEFAALWLAEQVEWLRHRAEVAEVAWVIDRAAQVLTGIVDRPGDRRWLGQCGADLDDDERCEGDVYGRVEAVWARCHTCGASYATDERRAWLDELARERSYTARVIGEAYDIHEGTIRTWAHRGEITSDGEEDGRPTYLLGPVLDLAARKRAAREERRARRMDAATYPDTTDRKAAS